MLGSQKQQRELARHYFEIASTHLCDDPNSDPDLRSYREFLDHEEFELVLSELEKVGKARRVSNLFWMALAVAAIQIGHRDRVKEYDLLISNSERPGTSLTD